MEHAPSQAGKTSDRAGQFLSSPKLSACCPLVPTWLIPLIYEGVHLSLRSPESAVPALNHCFMLPPMVVGAYQHLLCARES